MKLGTPASRPIFVIGTGRSGTHWLGFSLGNHPEVRATVEEKPVFGLATKMALNPALEDGLFGKLVEAYRRQLAEAAPLLYLDKSHPNIWLAEKLKEAFPQALFVGIERNPYATVASMVVKAGITAWHRRRREFPVPNRFLGITRELADTYDDIPLAAQCAMRWLAHHNRMNELRGVLAGSLMVISYETFAHHTAAVIHELQQFIGVHAPIPVPEVKLDSLTKWRTQLSETEVGQVQDVVGVSPESAGL